MKLQLDQQADFSADSVDSSATSDMETDNGYYHAPEPIHTSSTVAPAKRTVHIPPFIIPAVVIILLALALTLIPWHKKSSLDSIYRSSAQDIQTSLGVTLSENPDFVSKLSIPNQDPTGFNVYTTGNEDFGVIYYNGQQAGICFDSSKYALFGISVGDSESHLLTQAEATSTLSGDHSSDNSAGYHYTDYFSMLEEMRTHGSTADYFVGADGSVLVLVINDTSHRVVNIIYYYNGEHILKDISLI